jgi:putative spermidine/putrescine transport system permease protein
MSRAIGAFGDILDRLGISKQSWPMSAAAVLLALFLVLPTIITIPLSFSPGRTMVFPPLGYSTTWYVNFLTPDWVNPLLTSTVIGLIVAGLATSLGLLAAIGIELARERGGRVELVRTVLVLPIVVPHIVIAVALFLAFARVGLTGTMTGIAIAHTVLVLPFSFVVMSAALRTLDPSYVRAASTLGARPPRIIRRILVPLLLPAVYTSLFLSFILSFDEPVVSIFLSGVDVKTLPRRMFEALSMESDPRVAVVGSAGIVLTSVVLVAIEVARRRQKRFAGDP